MSFGKLSFNKLSIFFKLKLLILQFEGYFNFSSGFSFLKVLLLSIVLEGLIYLWLFVLSFFLVIFIRNLYFIECLRLISVSEEILLFILFQFSFDFIQKIIEISYFFNNFSVIIRSLKNFLSLSINLFFQCRVHILYGFSFLIDTLAVRYNFSCEIKGIDWLLRLLREILCLKTFDFGEF